MSKANYSNNNFSFKTISQIQVKTAFETLTIKTNRDSYSGSMHKNVITPQFTKIV